MAHDKGLRRPQMILCRLSLQCRNNVDMHPSAVAAAAPTPRDCFDPPPRGSDRLIPPRDGCCPPLPQGPARWLSLSFAVPSASPRGADAAAAPPGGGCCSPLPRGPARWLLPTPLAVAAAPPSVADAAAPPPSFGGYAPFALRWQLFHSTGHRVPCGGPAVAAAIPARRGCRLPPAVVSTALPPRSGIPRNFYSAAVAPAGAAAVTAALQTSTWLPPPPSPRWLPPTPRLWQLLSPRASVGVPKF